MDSVAAVLRVYYSGIRNNYIGIKTVYIILCFNLSL